MIFDGAEKHLSLSTGEEMKWFFWCEGGLFIYNTEESCKKAADYFKVRYYELGKKIGYYEGDKWYDVAVPLRYAADIFRFQPKD